MGMECMYLRYTNPHTSAAEPGNHSDDYHNEKYQDNNIALSVSRAFLHDDVRYKDDLIVTAAARR